MAAYTGATMLGGQVAWMRLAQVQVGSGLLAAAVSLSAAMGGLALGAGLAGRLLARRPIGRIALLQQLLAAVALLASPWLIGAAGSAAFRAGQRLELELAQWLLAGSAGVALAILNVPFGMLLPVAVELDVAHRRRHLSRRGGLFYAIQSGGAALGAIGLGLAAPAAWGFGATLLAAAAGHVLMLLWLIRLTRRWGPLREPPVVAAIEPLADQAEEQDPPRWRRRGVLGLALWLGMLGLSAELLWLRGLAFHLRASVYVYGLTTALFVAALVVGSLAGAYWTPSRRRPGQFLATLVLLTALTLTLSCVWLDRLAVWLASAGGPGGDWTGQPSVLGRLTTLLGAAALVVCPSAILMGLAFPPLLRLAGGAASLEATGSGRATGVVLDRPGQAGRVVGRVVAFNSLGAVLGPAVTFTILLGVLDQRRSLLAVAVGYLLAALWAEVVDPATGWSRSRSRAAPPDRDRGQPLARTRHQRLRQAKRYRIPWLNIALFAAGAGLCLWQAEQGSMFRQAYLSDLAVGPGGRPDEQAESQTVWIQLTESREAVVAVRHRTSDGNSELLVNRDIQGDDSPLGLRVQRRQGVLPLVLGRSHPRRALVIGLGTGTTVAPLVQAGVERVTVAELVGPVAKAALEEFALANDNLRTRVVRELTPLPDETVSAGQADSEVCILHADGRTLLRRSEAAWDLILVDIVYPTAPGAGGLFSEQFYRLAFERLSPEGLFVHWLPLWQVAPDDAAGVVAAFLAGFGPPDHFTSAPPGRVGVFSLPRPGRPMVALVGARQPLDLSRAALAARIDSLQPILDRSAGRYRPTMADLDLGEPEQLWASLLPESMLKAWAGDARPATDRFPRTELRSPLGHEPSFGPGNIERLLRIGYAGADYAEQVAEAIGRPAQQDFDRAKMSQVFHSRRLLAEAFRLPQAGDAETVYGLLERSAKADPQNAFARFHVNGFRYDFGVQDVLRRRGRGEWTDDQAIARLQEIDQQWPHELDAIELKAEVQRSLGRLGQAVATLNELLERAPRSADVPYRQAQWLVELAERQRQAGDPQGAHHSASQARTALNRARDARQIGRNMAPDPSAYQQLGQRIKAQLRAGATQPASAPD